MKIVIVGGVAAGASCAARLRRLDEQAEIVLLERGAFISFANCGLPYHIGGTIPARQSLVLMAPQAFHDRFNVDVRIESTVTAIDPAGHRVTVRTADGRVYDETYDKLVLATGASPLRPPLPGMDDPAVHPLWTIPDLDRIMARVDGGARRALVVGAGFVGLEAAENLRERGLSVTVAEGMDQILAPLDREMTRPLVEELATAGITLMLGAKLMAFERTSDGLLARFEGGRSVTADFALVAIGVKPNSGLAAEAGLAVNARGGIVADAALATSHPDILAAGDVIEVDEPIYGGRTMIPLAGPANRQGRVAADNLVGRGQTYPGSWGVSIVKVGGLAAAGVGYNARRLAAEKRAFHTVYLRPASNATYYPGSAPLTMKLLFDDAGKILGAQIVGRKDVARRIDVIATAMQAGFDVRRLAMLELAYAPPFGSAKDPVNLAGMIASNMLDGLTVPVTPEGLKVDDFIVDVSEPAEFELGIVPGSVNIPLGALRGRMAELPRGRRIVTCCRVGLRGYIAERMLRQHGFDVVNLSGGYAGWELFQPPRMDRCEATVTPLPGGGGTKADERCTCGGDSLDTCGVAVVDVRGMQCPGPVVRLKQEVDRLPAGGSLDLDAPIGFLGDFEKWTARNGCAVTILSRQVNDFRARVTKSGVSACAAAAGGAAAHPGGGAIVLFSNDLDKAMAALIIACGMAASGGPTSIFFTFWGLSVLRRNPGPAVSKPLLDRMFGWMLPKGARALTLSKMHMAGMGTGMMKHVMAQKNVASIDELIAQARFLGVKFIACEMAMNVMGLTREELIPVDDVAGVASFVAMAGDSHSTLFI